VILGCPDLIYKEHLMHKTLIFTLAAVTVLTTMAFSAGSAAAENDPDVTYPTGVLLFATPEAPVSILATNVGNISIKPSKEVIWYQCSSSSMTGSLSKNTGSLFEATISSATFGGTAGGACTSTKGSFTITTDTGNGVPWCLRSTNLMAADEFQIRGNGCASAPRSITLTMMGCTYERTAPISGTLTTDSSSQDAVLSLENVEYIKEPNQLFCPGSTFLDTSYTLERDTTSTNDPLYIS
jgi:hypothetical protein